MKHHRLQAQGGEPVQVPLPPNNTRAWLNGAAFNDGAEPAIDLFAFEDGFCNGPRCVDCGYSACHHCTPMWWSLKNCPGEVT